MSHPTLQDVLRSGVKLTPMMEQYSHIKSQHQDKFVWFRMGDFYEMFFEDAVEISKLLNITLTHRGKLGDFSIPMSGIPYHAASNYIERLTSQGYRVAICEQVENPKEAKGIVKREVTQVVSPGMPFDLDKSPRDETHYLVSAFKGQDSYYLAGIDFSTGDFFGQAFEGSAELFERLQLLGPKELIAYPGQWEDEGELSAICSLQNILICPIAKEYFEEKNTAPYLKRLLPHYSKDSFLKQGPELIFPVGALAYYFFSTRPHEQAGHLRPFRFLAKKGLMKVARSTLVGLEILPKSRESLKDSLLGMMDCCQTAMGSRKLREFFTTPLYDKEAIEERFSSVQWLVDNHETLSALRGDLGEVRDVERILAKSAKNSTTASDLINLSASISCALSLSSGIHGTVVAATFKDATNEDKEDLNRLQQEIEKSLNKDIGAALEKGNLIKEGIFPERDRLAGLSQNADQSLTDLEKKLREELEIPKLRIKKNNVAGYFIEVSKIHASKVPSHFIRRQTLVNSERYTTEELSNFEKEVLQAKFKLEAVEREIFNDLVKNVKDINLTLHSMAQSIAKVDVFSSFAWTALQEDFIRPEILDSKNKGMKAEGMWHPLIKRALTEQFIGHDLDLNPDKFFGLITGPNMAGKTTVMREVATLQILTQIGSFVPALSASLSLVDGLFSRLGASDDILNGQSTFMVEMAETAEILRHATENSLIILDEVGRGTSTFDGLSLAWSILEHLVNKTQAKGLFATHYHELIEVADNLKGAVNLTVDISVTNGKVEFLYNLIEGAAKQSFGQYVAEMAGLPQSLLSRSADILETFESTQKQEQPSINLKTSMAEKSTINPAKKGQQLCFLDGLGHGTENEKKASTSKLQQMLKALDPHRMTPIQALAKLEELKSINYN